MLFGMIRLLLIIIAVVLVIFYLKKRKYFKKSVIVLSIFMAILLGSMTGFIPVENLFITFSSPQSVFQYTTIGEIETYINGKASTLVFYEKPDGPNSYIIFPKAKNGWKVGTYLTYETLYNNFHSQKYLIILLHTKKTSDHYVVIYNLQSINRKVSDNLGSEFHYYSGRQGSFNQADSIYYAAFSRDDGPYNITIDGETIDILT